MRRGMLQACAIGASAVALLVSGAVRVAGEEGTAAPIFTSQQASAGKVAYAKNCASCHMPDLSGNVEIPPLAGAAFKGTWGTRTTKDLLDYMSAAMPYGAPSLTAETYLTLTAYILESNGAIAGDHPFSADTAVTIDSVTPASSAKP